MRVQIACAAQSHIVWVVLAADLAQSDWDAILAAVASHGCPRCAGTWTAPTAPTVDAREWPAELDAALQVVADPALPVCDCPCHSHGLVESSECFCIPECVRGEARALDFLDRDAMVAWLVENDRGGAHADEDAMAELGRVHTLGSAIRCYVGVMDLDDQQA
jgi:hypothetical protein